MRMDDAQGRSSALALVGIQKVWEDVARSPFVQRDLGQPIDRLPDIGEQAVAARSARAVEALAILDQAAVADLPHDLALTHAVARSTALRMSKEADRYWLAFDPLGIGFFAMFAPTAYGGGFLLSDVAGTLAKHRFETVGDLDRYLGLIEDYGRLVDQMTERTAGQAERGIRLPRAQLVQSIELVTRLRAGSKGLAPTAARLAALDSASAQSTIQSRIDTSVIPAFSRLLGLLESADYAAAAPERVGMAQYPGGAELYGELVREHTTMDISPEAVHAAGLVRMTEVRRAMTEILAETGFEGSAQAYWASTAESPAWRANTAEEIAAVFRKYIDRIEPLIDTAFRFRPRAPHDVTPLPEALSAAMTFGYYDPPSPGQAAGRYIFNATNLAGGTLAGVASLNYHELVPGHHFHIASQRENDALHPVRAHAFFNAFNEGWAEYAATLAGEAGMYVEPEERFGRLAMDAFLVCRLVVDTGMNALGWDLEDARDYMRENAFMPESEIGSESIRYSCDIPAQSLAYKLGETFLIEQREAMRAALGDRFDLKDFHDAVLKPGGLPLPLVARNIEAATARLAAS